jgi:cytochrome d ubiquinol oxidase subunit II
MEPLNHTQEILAIGWWLTAAFSVLAYIVLDGADLGAGIFSMFLRDEHERGAIMQAMAGTWDANETWLIVAGGVLFGSFPFVYGSAFAYLMVPLTCVLLAIMVRAVALEYRHLASDRTRRFTDWVFGLGSLTVAFFGGMSVGALLHGFPLTNAPDQVPTYVGGAWRFISPFSIWTAVAAVIAVSLSGGLFVRARFEHGESVRARAATWTNRVFYLAITAVPISTLWIAIEFPWASRTWFGPYFWVWWLMPAAAIVTSFLMRHYTNRDRDVLALFWLNITIVIMAGGLLATMYPAIIPDTWTIDTGASREIKWQTFALEVVGFYPVMLTYNLYQIWVFRSRITKLASYHN